MYYLLKIMFIKKTVLFLEHDDIIHLILKEQIHKIFMQC